MEQWPSPWQPTKERKGCQEEENTEKRDVKRRGRTCGLTPHYPFLIEQVVDDLDTVTHLRLCTLGHGNDGTNDLARFNVVERRDSIVSASLEVLSVACQVRPPNWDSVLTQQFLRHMYY